MSEILRRRPAGNENEVVTVTARADDKREPCRTPCPGCPWRIENAGSFPAEAFEHSAETSYDMSQTMFGCHESGSERPRTCAGYLLSTGAEHNLSVRLAQMDGRLDLTTIAAAGAELHPSYRDMAIANGVSPDHPALKPCR